MQHGKATSVGAILSSADEGRGEYYYDLNRSCSHCNKSPQNWRRRDNCGTSNIVAPAYSGSAYPEINIEGARIFTQSNRQRNDTGSYNGIGVTVKYQARTGLRQHGFRLLPVTKPEAIDPGHRLMLKDLNPFDSVKDAYSRLFNQRRNF